MLISWNWATLAKNVFYIKRIRRKVQIFSYKFDLLKKRTNIKKKRAQKARLDGPCQQANNSFVHGLMTNGMKLSQQLVLLWELLSTEPQDSHPLSWSMDEKPAFWSTW